MKRLITVITTEMMKFRRTLGFWLALAAPVGISGLECLVMWSQGESLMEFSNGQPWLWHTKYILTLWGIFMLPLFITLETALSAQWEHRGQTWKMLYTQPVPKWVILFGKQFSGLVLIGISHVVLWAAILGTGLLLREIRPDLGFKAPPPWMTMLGYSTIIFGISWLILSIHSFVSLRWSHFVVAMGTGIIATLSGVFFISSDYAHYYPWAMSGLTANKLLDNGWPATQLALGIGGGMLIYLAGNLYLAGRDVT